MLWFWDDMIFKISQKSSYSSFYCRMTHICYPRYVPITTKELVRVAPADSPQIAQSFTCVSTSYWVIVRMALRAKEPTLSTLKG